MSNNSYDNTFTKLLEEFEIFQNEIKEFYDISLKSLKLQLQDTLKQYEKTKDIETLKKLTYLTKDIFDQLSQRQALLIKHKKEILKLTKEKEKHDKDKWKF